MKITEELTVLKTDNPEECDDGKKRSSKTKVYGQEEEQEEEEEDDNDDRTVSKSSTYSVNYPSFSRESSVTLPYNVASIEGIFFQLPFWQ